MTTFVGEEISVGKRYVYLKNERTGSSTVRKLKMVGVCIDAHKLKFQRHFSEATYWDKYGYSGDETKTQIDRVNEDDVICEWPPLGTAMTGEEV